MGLEPTDFDLDIMSKERADFIDRKYSAGDELLHRKTVLRPPCATSPAVVSLLLTCGQFASTAGVGPPGFYE